MDASITDTQAPVASLSDTPLSKVPQGTPVFWMIQLLSTTVGTTLADFLNVQLGLGLTITTLVMIILLGSVLIAQLELIVYVPAVYWLTVVVVSIVGTLASDSITAGVGVPLWVATLMFSLALTSIFILWFSREKTLELRSITTVRRE